MSDLTGGEDTETGDISVFDRRHPIHARKPGDEVAPRPPHGLMPLQQTPNPGGPPMDFPRHANIPADSKDDPR
jgi:hypothetical protein